MEDFFNAEISIYSRAEFFIYLFEDLFSTNQIKCRYLHKINEKSRGGINGYSCIKKPLLWEWHFYKLLCEEMIFLLPSGKNDGLRYEVILPHSSWLCQKIRDSPCDVFWEKGKFWWLLSKLLINVRCNNMRKMC